MIFSPARCRPGSTWRQPSSARWLRCWPALREPTDSSSMRTASTLRLGATQKVKLFADASGLTMDSLPTGSMQSWLIVIAVALGPTTALLAVNAVGRVRRRRAPARQEEGLAGSQ